jgi:glycosyltransferase involved in cell wall biosynthesis
MFDYLTSIKHKFSNFYFLGTIIPDSKTEYYKKQPIWEKTTYIHPATREQIKEYLNLSKIGLVLLPDTANNRLGYSTKLFEYMTAGLPVIVSNLPLNAGIVQEHNCGIIIDLNDEKEFINAVDTLLSNPELAQKMGEAGKRAVLSNYCWEHEGQQLLNLYNSLLKNG